MQTSKRNPPIQYLIAFEAAARHNSFTGAANELHITPSAISQQIKALENAIGLSLFHRKAREIHLTSAGIAYYGVAEKTLATYTAGFAQFQEQFFSPALRISMISYIANEVVIPRLHEFSMAHPDIDLTIETSMRIEQIDASDLDGAIRYGIPPWGANDVEKICDVAINLVATSQYFEKNPLNDVSDFEKQTLIHLRSEVNDWERVMQFTGFHFKPEKQLFFDSYDAAIRAAEAGLGLAIGIFPVTHRKVAEGKLTTVIPQHIPVEDAYYLVTRPNTNKSASYGKLSSWLKTVFANL